MLPLLVVASCNVWPGDLGLIDLPHDEAAEADIPQRSFEAESVSEPRSLDDGIEAIRARTPSDEGQTPRAVRAVGESLVPLTVSEMRALVLSNNLDLEVALFDPQIAAQRVSAEEGRFDALIGSRFDYQRKDTPRIDGPIVDFTSSNPALSTTRSSS